MGGVTLRKLEGKVLFHCPIERGLLKFGQRYLGTNPNRLNSVWELSGNIFVSGPCFIGNGCKVCVEGNLYLGSGVSISGNSHIYCKKKISIANNCLISWDVLLMDNDSHPIYDNLGNLINAPKSISVGNHVWIGCRSLVLKGSYIPDDVVIAADSTITKKMTESHCIIGGKGHDVHVLKHDVNWNS